MANNRFNKQVTPKGYKAGGRTGYAAGDVIKTDAGKKGMVVETGSPGTEGQYNKAAKARLKKIISNRKIMNNPKASGAAKKSAKKQNKFLTGGKGQNFLKPVKSYKMGGRIRKMGGGSLKPVNPKTQKGLSKLPTEVRNKMGYMQDGGKVKDKPGKNLTFGKTYHPITELAMKNAMLTSFKSGGKKGFSFGKISDEHKKIKEKFFEKGVKPSEIQKLDKEFKARIDRAKASARKTLANRPGMKSYRKKQQKAKAIDTGSEN